MIQNLDEINKKLLDYFGKFENGESNWKLVWSENEFEKRLVTHTKDGFELIHPEVQECRKFGYIKDRYVLVKLMPVPSESVNLLGKLSYEPIWTFEDNKGNPLEPIWEAIQVLVNTINENVFNAGHKAPYKIPEEQQNTLEGRKYRASKLYEQLYGNETDITDALSRDSAVGYGKRNRN